MYCSMVTLLLLLAIVMVKSSDPDIGLGMNLILARGYPMEIYNITTDDGYITQMFDIPHGKGVNSDVNRPPVLLQHGVMVSSYTWVSNFEDQSLAFILADAGYDVWLSNSRGTTPWGTDHVSLNPTSKDYWEFTWDQMAQYDVKANIAFILDKTGFKKLSYVCHSQGCTIVIAGLIAGHVDVNEINYIASMAPVVHIKHSGSLLLQAAADSHLATLLSDMGFGEFLPSDHLLEKLLPSFCSRVDVACDDVLELLCGHSHFINETRIDVYLSFTPAGTSVDNLNHWSQGIRNDNFQAYDWGCDILHYKNQEKYGQKTPPVYDLSLFPKNLKMSIFHSAEDYLSDGPDVATLLSSLPEGVVDVAKEITGYSHMDFVWGVDANRRVYDDILQLLKLVNADNNAQTEAY